MDICSTFLNYLERVGRVRYIPDDEKDHPTIVRYFVFLRDKQRNIDPTHEERDTCFNIFLHHLITPDLRDLHDHPWWYITIILKGGYDETTPEGTFRRGPGSIIFRKAESLHRIVPAKNCWTLFIRGKKTTQWGFMVDGKWVHHLKYLKKIGGYIV